jgi:ABC-type glycerol-3-phosphate transport system substrate-binding protein
MITLQTVLGRGLAAIVLAVLAAGCGGGGAGGAGGTAPSATSAQSAQSVFAIYGQDAGGVALRYAGLPASLGTVSVSR